MIHYVNQERPILPGVDLGIAQNTLQTITAGNKEALQQASNLKTAIANMDLNEAEDGFRAALYDDINKTIEDNTLMDNPYYALDDIIKKQGDIASNPALIGRLNAQKAYKDYQNNIDSRKDINEDTKTWAKELNPYQYQDKIDDKGNVVGGSTWTPSFTPVRDIDMNEVFDAISKQLKPQTSGWSGASAFMNADGSTSRNYIPGQTISVWSESSGSYERVTEDMISNAINNAFQNNPELAAGARQQYDVLTWKANKGELTPENDNTYNGNGGYYDKNGVAKTYNQYIRDMIDGYASTHAYNNTVSKVSYNNAAIKAAYDAQNTIVSQSNRSSGSGNGDIDLQGLIARSHQYNLIETKKSMFGPATTAYNQTTSRIISGLNDFGIKIDTLPDDPKSLYNLINYDNLNDNQKADFDKLVNYYIDQRDKWNSEFDIRESAMRGDGSANDAKVVLAQQIISDLSQGYDISELLNSTNPYAQEYKKVYDDVVNNAFGNNDSLTFKAKNANQFIQTLTKNGITEDNLRNLGFIVENNSITIPKENSRLILIFNNLLKAGVGDVYGNTDDGQSTRITKEQTQFAATARNLNFLGLRPFKGIIKSKQGFSRRIDKLTNALQKPIEDNDNEVFNTGEENIYVGSSTSIGTTPLDLQNRAIWEATGDPARKRMIDAAQESFKQYLTGAHINENIWEQTENGVSKLITDVPTKEKVIEQLKNGGSDGKFVNTEPHVAFVDGIGVLPAFKYSIKNDNGKIETHDIIFENFIGDLDYEEINNRPDIVNPRRLASYRLNGNLPVMIGKLHGNNIEAQWVNDDKNYNISYYKVNIAGQPTDYILTKDEVNQLSIYYNNLIDQRNKFAADIAEVQNSNISEEQKVETINNYILGYVQENPIFYNIFGDQAFDIIQSTLTR